MIKIRKEIIIALVIIFIIPVVINFILLIPFSMAHVADAKTWLEFWGCYLGGIVAVCSAYYIFCRQLDVEAKRKEYEIRLAEYNSLSRDLSELCSSMWTGTIFISLIKTEPENVSAELYNGIEKGKKLKYELNGFLIKYHPQNEEGAKFVYTCKEFQKKFCDILKEAGFVCAFNTKDDARRSDVLKKMSVVCNYDTICNETDTLYDYALEWNEKERENIDEIRKEYMSMLKR